MNLINQFKALQNYFDTAGISFTSILNLISGKATSKEIADTVEPLLIKVNPAFVNALRHSSNQHGEECHFVISLAQDEQGRDLVALSVATIGQIERKETIALHKTAHYVVAQMEQAKAQKRLTQ